MGWGGMGLPLTGCLWQGRQMRQLRCCSLLGYVAAKRQKYKTAEREVQRPKQNGLEPKGGKKYPRQNIARANQGPISAPHRPQLNALSDTNNRWLKGQIEQSSCFFPLNGWSLNGNTITNMQVHWYLRWQRNDADRPYTAMQLEDTIPETCALCKGPGVDNISPSEKQQI